MMFKSLLLLLFFFSIEVQAINCPNFLKIAKGKIASIGGSKKTPVQPVVDEQVKLILSNGVRDPNVNDFRKAYWSGDFDEKTRYISYRPRGAKDNLGFVVLGKDDKGYLEIAPVDSVGRIKESDSFLVDPKELGNAKLSESTRIKVLGKNNFTASSKAIDDNNFAKSASVKFVDEKGVEHQATVLESYRESAVGLKLKVNYIDSKTGESKQRIIDRMENQVYSSPSSLRSVDDGTSVFHSNRVIHGQEGQVNGETPAGKFVAETHRGYGDKFGTRKEVNEDAFAVFHQEDTTLLVSVDGVGGVGAGDVAAGAVVQHIEEGFKAVNTKVAKEVSDDVNQVTQMQQMFDDAPKSLAKAHQRGQGNNSMGAAFAAAELRKHPAKPGHYLLRSYHAGDSRVMAISGRSGDTLLETRDHSLINKYMDDYNVSEEQARQMIRKEDGLSEQMIVQAVRVKKGQAGNLETTVTRSSVEGVGEVSVKDGDKIALFSDGVTDSLDPQTIKEIVHKYNPERAKRELLLRIEEKAENLAQLNRLQRYKDYERLSQQTEEVRGQQLKRLQRKANKGSDSVDIMAEYEGWSQLSPKNKERQEKMRRSLGQKLDSGELDNYKRDNINIVIFEVGS